MASYAPGTGCLCYSCWTSDVQQNPREPLACKWDLMMVSSASSCSHYKVLRERSVAISRFWLWLTRGLESASVWLEKHVPLHCSNPRKSNAVTLPLWCLFSFDVVHSYLHLPVQSWLSVRVRVNALNLVLIKMTASAGVTKLWNKICPYTTWKSGFVEAQSLGICDWGIEQPSQNPKALCIFAPWEYHSKEFACVCHLALTNHIWRMATVRCFLCRTMIRWRGE